MADVIYLDHQATTPVDSEVLDAMLPYFCEHFGNPSSSTHPVGWQAKLAVEKARKQVAQVISADPKEIIFTSGATEANNMAVLGLLKGLDSQKKVHLLTSQVEHPAILNSFKAAESEYGAEVEFLPVNRYGQVEIETIEKAIKENTVLMSFIAASNEIGSINPLKEIGALAKKKNVLFHTDATQAIGKFEIDVEEMGIDLLSLSAHKIYGPKGVGALFVRHREPHVHIKPLLFGGGQEEGHRSGTLNVSGIVGLGKACELCTEKWEEDNQHYQKLREAFLDTLNQSGCKYQINGHPEQRIMNNLHLSFPGRESAAGKLGNVACSAGSACSSSKAHPSHVLSAIGVDSECVKSSLRIGFGRINTVEDAKKAAEKIACYCTSH